MRRSRPQLRSGAWREEIKKALNELLGDQPHLFGEAPAGVDATAFGMLSGILTPFFASPLRDEALRHRNLIAYTGRMMKAYFPEHPWEVGAERIRAS